MPVKQTRKSVVQEGLPHPSGASWDGKGTNFALFSANATKVELCLFDERGERERRAGDDQHNRLDDRILAIRGRQPAAS